MRGMLQGNRSVFTRMLAVVLALLLLLSNASPLALAWGNEIRIRVDGEVLEDLWFVY